MNLKILNAKHHFCLHFTSFFLFILCDFFILRLVFFYDSTFLNDFSLFLLSRDVVLLAIAQVLSRAYWL